MFVCMCVRVYLLAYIQDMCPKTFKLPFGSGIRSKTPIACKLHSRVSSDPEFMVSTTFGSSD